MSDRCPRCEAFYAQYPLIDGEHVLDTDEWGKSTASPIQCAFDNGKFTTENWSCQTMIVLRELTQEWHEATPRWVAWTMRDDMCSASIGVLPIPECDDSGSDTQHRADAIQQGYLVMTWYKNRGCTGQAWVLWDDCEPQLLNLPTAEFILAAHPEMEEEQ